MFLTCKGEMKMSLLTRIESIEQTTTEIKTGVDKLLLWKSGLEQICLNHREKTEKIEDILYDEEKGLISRIKFLELCKKQLQTWREFGLSLLEKVISWAIIAFICWMLLVYGEWSGKRKEKVERQETTVERKVSTDNQSDSSYQAN